MTLEHDSEHVVGFPLVPVGHTPDRFDRMNLRLLPGQTALEAVTMPMRHGVDDVNNLYPVFPIDAPQEFQMIHHEARVVAQKPADFHDGTRFHRTERKVPVELRFRNPGAKLFFQ